MVIEHTDRRPAERATLGTNGHAAAKRPSRAVVPAQLPPSHHFQLGASPVARTAAASIRHPHERDAQMETFERWFSTPVEGLQVGSAAERQQVRAGAPGGRGSACGHSSLRPRAQAMEMTEEERLLVIDRLHSIMRPFMMRREKAQVRLPQLTRRAAYINRRPPLRRWSSSCWTRLSACCAAT